MPTTEYSDNIRQVDKVGGREQRHANCAGNGKLCLPGSHRRRTYRYARDFRDTT
ncbi:Torsin-4A-A, partial [Dissostichus eleginoides]